MIYIVNKKTKLETIAKKYPNALVCDVTSKATDKLVKLSPFYPHGGIPIPFSEGRKAMCVEGIWQGLKVFENADIDEAMFLNDKMKDIKRTVRKYGKPLGHRKGIKGKELLPYIAARIEIFLPSYLWVLEHKVGHITEELKAEAKGKNMVLLDYTTNCNVLNPKTPLSHAYLVKAYIEDNYPKAADLYKALLAQENGTPTLSIRAKKNNNKNDNSQTSLF